MGQKESSDCDRFSKADEKVLLASVYEPTDFPTVIADVVLQYAGIFPASLYTAVLAEQEFKWKQAFGHFTRAAAQGSGFAMCQLAKYYIYSFRATKCDFQEAEKLLDRAEEQDITEVGLWRGLLQAERCEWANSPAGLRKAIDLWRATDPSVTLAHALAAWAEIRMQHTNRTVVESELKRLLPSIQSVALAGDPVYQAFLAQCYYRGFGLPKDRKMSHKLWEAASRHGHVRSVCSAASDLVNAIGCDRDYAKAAQMLVEGQTSRHPAVLSQLGVLYASGIGVAREPDTAVSLYTQAAEMGCSSAMSWLACHLEVGEGCARDEKAAFKWREQSIQHGDLSAICNLANAHATGRGTERDCLKAKELFELAAKEGHSYAVYALALQSPRSASAASDDGMQSPLSPRSPTSGALQDELSFDLDRAAHLYQTTLQATATNDGQVFARR